MSDSNLDDTNCVVVLTLMIQEMFSAMVMSADTMLERWASNGGKEVDVAIEFKIMTSEVISRSAFGSSYLQGKNIFEMLTALGSLVFRSFYKPRFLGLEYVPFTACIVSYFCRLVFESYIASEQEALEV